MSWNFHKFVKLEMQFLLNEVNNKEIIEQKVKIV